MSKKTRKPTKPHKTLLKTYHAYLTYHDNPVSKLDELFSAVKKDVPNLSRCEFDSECRFDCYNYDDSEFSFVFHTEISNPKYKEEYEKYKRELALYKKQQEDKDNKLTEDAKKLLTSRGYKVVQAD